MILVKRVAKLRNIEDRFGDSAPHLRDRLAFVTASFFKAILKLYSGCCVHNKQLNMLGDLRII